MDLKALEYALAKFCNDRDWEQFHSPKNLVMALTGEVGELTELFQWLTETESRQIMNNLEMAKRVNEEMADVFLYLIRLASQLGVDLEKAAHEKMALNARKYPIETARGKSTKYDEL